jgi:hypothetical protein
MAQYSLKINVYCTLCLRHGINFSDYRLFSEWLGCYEYILPAHRGLIPELSFSLLTHYDGDMHKTYHRYIMIDANHTIPDQKEIIKWISDYNNYHIAAGSRSIPVRENISYTV